MSEGYLSRAELEELVFEDAGRTVAVTDERTLAKLRKLVARLGAPDDLAIIYIHMRGDRFDVSWSAPAGGVQGPRTQ
jgi:hypothetical protein